MTNKERLIAIAELQHIQRLIDLLRDAIAGKNRNKCIDLMREIKRLNAEWLERYSYNLTRKEL